MARLNLIFFSRPGRQAKDFLEVSRRISERSPDIAPFVYTTRTWSALRSIAAGPWLARRPTVSVEMDSRNHRPRILRGVRLGHRSDFGKIAQYEFFETHDIPIPKWTTITPDTSLDPEEWGPYVVVKPSLGTFGAYVWIQKTGRFRYKEPDDYPKGHRGRKSPMVAQRFIYTGPWPVSYRVLTYFAEPIYAARCEGRHDLAPLDNAAALGKGGGGRSIVASAKGCTITLAEDPEILSLARRVHSLLPRTPSLGIDIVREYQTGELYLLEVNDGGHVWHISSNTGLQIQKQFGLDFYSQFDALNRVADRSIQIAYEYAR